MVDALIAPALINLFAVLIYAITSFGNAILYHLFYHLCNEVLSPSGFCVSDSIAIVVIHVTAAGVVIYPLQLWLLWSSINWPLAIHIALSQQIGLAIGLFTLFLVKSIWISRWLGFVFFIVAIQKLRDKHDDDDDNLDRERDDEEVEKPHFQITGYRRKVLVCMTGLTSGLFGGLFATGGPPLIWFVTSVNLPPLETRATLSFTFFCENLGRLIFFFAHPGANDLFRQEIQPSLFFVLALTSAISLILGNQLALKLGNQRLFRYFLTILLFFGSLLLMVGDFSFEYSIIIVISASAIFSFFSIPSCQKLIHHLRESRDQGASFPRLSSFSFNMTTMFSSSSPQHQHQQLQLQLQQHKKKKQKKPRNKQQSQHEDVKGTVAEGEEEAEGDVDDDDDDDDNDDEGGEEDDKGGKGVGVEQREGNGLHGDGDKHASSFVSLSLPILPSSVQYTALTQMEREEDREEGEDEEKTKGMPVAI